MKNSTETARERLQKLMVRGSEILGSKYPILGGAMTWISESDLVSAMSNAGIFGVLASGAMDGDLLRNEIELTRQKTANNFGVNIILMNPKLHDLIDVCGEQKVSGVILAGGIPDRSITDKIRAYGMKVIAFAPSLTVAKRLFKHGADALILEGNEAGGHVGPLSAMVLIQAVLLNMKDYPIFVAGGVFRGEMFASLLQLGAVGCQLGTVFACCRESTAHKNFKEALLKADGRNAVLPVQLDKRFPIAPVRAVENAGTEEFIAKQREVLAKFDKGGISAEDAKLTLEHFWAGALRKAVREGDVERGSLMAGQIVELVKEERSVREITDAFLTEAENFLAAHGYPG
ncbi:MAG: nitronate monooxygenase [Holosporaceae bacterium]|jgi:enoyl-[acyl-carrier protein] reductase II|nr:nitronate monooxygenase [Holosporaceae bacterium]